MPPAFRSATSSPDADVAAAPGPTAGLVGGANVGALLITSRILGVPHYSYSVIILIIKALMLRLGLLEGQVKEINHKEV